MDTLYNKIDKIVNEIRDVKDFIIFEGSKFINKIIKSSSDKDFINFLKLKLNPIAAIQDTTDKRSVFEKIFKKRYFNDCKRKRAITKKTSRLEKIKN